MQKRAPLGTGSKASLSSNSPFSCVDKTEAFYLGTPKYVTYDISVPSKQFALIQALNVGKTLLKVTSIDPLKHTRVLLSTELVILVVFEK